MNISTILALTFLSCLLLLTLVNQTKAAKKQLNKKYFSIKDLMVSEKFKNRKFNGTWISENQFIHPKSDEGGIFLYNLETQKSTLFLPEDVVKKLRPDQLEVSPDQKFLLSVNDEFMDPLQMHSWRFQLYDIKNGIITQLAGNQLLRMCFFARDHSVVYALNNNVFYIEDPSINLKPLPLTTDGIPDTIYNLVPDYVYGDVLTKFLNTDYQVSRNGTWIAIACFDDSKVENTTFYTYGQSYIHYDQYPKIQHVRYPEVGKTNPTVTVKVLKLTNATNSTWVTFDAPPNTEILGAVTWASDSDLAMVWMSRLSDKTFLVICYVEMRTCENTQHRHEPHGWISARPPLFSRINNKIFIDIMPFPQGDISYGEWMHVAKFTPGNETPEAMTSGLKTVISIEGWVEDADLIYYLSTLEEEPWKQHLFVTGSRDECVSCDMKFTDGELCNYVEVEFSHNNKYFALTCDSKPPSYTVLYNAETAKPVTLWQDNAVLKEEINTYYLPQIKIFRVHLPDSDTCIKMFFPPNFDPEEKNVTYPLIVHIYSGQNLARVISRHVLDYHIYWPTKRNYIYVRIEGRGSNLKGNKNLFANHRRLGTIEVDDVINGTRYLLNTFPWIDKNKVALWGWSYGGYSCLQGLIRDPSDIYKCAVIVAPIVDFQRIFTFRMERYMGTPTLEDNLEGYENASILNHVMNLRGKRFAILHGNADENVHYGDTLQLFKKLQQAGIDFEQMSYPEESHDLGGVMPHVFHFIDDFWERCFSS